MHTHTRAHARTDTHAFMHLSSASAKSYWRKCWVGCEVGETVQMLLNMSAICTVHGESET